MWCVDREQSDLSASVQLVHAVVGHHKCKCLHMPFELELSACINCCCCALLLLLLLLTTAVHASYHTWRTRGTWTDRWVNPQSSHSLVSLMSCSLEPEVSCCQLDVAFEILHSHAPALRLRLLHKYYMSSSISRFVRGLLLVQLCAAIACLSAV
jgi:hypothetical protein